MTDPAKPTYWYPRPKKKLERYLVTQDANGKEQVYKAQNEELMQAWLDAFKPGQEQGWPSRVRLHVANLSRPREPSVTSDNLGAAGEKTIRNKGH